jgi:hypothetical protein
VYRAVRLGVVAAIESASSPTLKMVSIKTVSTVPCAIDVVENEYHYRFRASDNIGTLIAQPRRAEQRGR